MDELTAELKEKFRRFHELYEINHQRLIDEGVTGAVLSGDVWQRTLLEMPLTSNELLLYKQLVAMHSVNGGDLFSDG